MQGWKKRWCSSKAIELFCLWTPTLQWFLWIIWIQKFSRGRRGSKCSSASTSPQHSEQGLMVNHARVPCYQKTSLEEESKMSHLSVFQTLCRKKPKRLDHKNINPTPLGDRTTRFLSWKLYRHGKHYKYHIPAGTRCLGIPLEGNLISSRNWGTSDSESEGHHKPHTLHWTKVTLILLASYLIHILYLCVLIWLGWGLLCFLLFLIFFIWLHLHLYFLTFPKLLITLLDQDSSSQLFGSGGRREIPYKAKTKDSVSLSCIIPQCISFLNEKQFLYKAVAPKAPASQGV